MRIPFRSRSGRSRRDARAAWPGGEGTKGREGAGAAARGDRSQTSPRASSRHGTKIGQAARWRAKPRDAEGSRRRATTRDERSAVAAGGAAVDPSMPACTRARRAPRSRSASAICAPPPSPHHQTSAWARNTLRQEKASEPVLGGRSAARSATVAISAQRVAREVRRPSRVGPPRRSPRRAAREAPPAPRSRPMRSRRIAIHLP
jgi:hypothetical protein